MGSNASDDRNVSAKEADGRTRGELTGGENRRGADIVIVIVGEAGGTGEGEGDLILRGGGGTSGVRGEVERESVQARRIVGIEGATVITTVRKSLEGAAE